MSIVIWTPYVAYFKLCKDKMNANGGQNKCVYQLKCAQINLKQTQGWNKEACDDIKARWRYRKRERNAVGG